MQDTAISLPPSAVGQPIRYLDPAVRVTVWIPRARHGWVQLDGAANAWTTTAAHVEYVDEHGRTGYAWVWASAVARL